VFSKLAVAGIDRDQIFEVSMRLTLSRPIILLAMMTLTGMMLPRASRADDGPPLYHSQKPTIGCANPNAVRLLTREIGPSQKTRSWVKSTFVEGRCISITPKSTWRLIFLNGDVAIMDYVGFRAPPGSYYFSVADMVDAHDHHPESIPVSPNRTDSQQEIGGSTVLREPSDSAARSDVSTAVISGASAGGVNSARAAELSPSLAATSSAQRNDQGAEMTSFLLVLVALALAAVLGALIGYRRPEA
jgi:hypothetical protein